MARFTLLMSYSEAGGEALSPEEMAAGRAAMDDYGRALHDAGVLVAADVLQPTSAGATIRGGEVVDSPQDAAPEQLSGIFLIDVADNDAAIEWAKRCPAAQWGTMTVRPTAVYLEDGVWRG